MADELGALDEVGSLEELGALDEDVVDATVDDALDAGGVITGLTLA